MKKSRILLPFVLLASFGMVTTLVSCTPKQGQKEEVPEEGYGVEIANKAALQETWFAGTSRNIDINLTPAGNVALELNNGNLKIESSNTQVLTITGQGLNAQAEGATTVTVKYHGHKDSVDLTISHKQTNKEKYGTEHEGTLEDPMTNEDACKVGKWVKDNGENTSDIYVQGVVRSWYHAPGSRTDGAVSYFLEPAEAGGERFEVYKCFKEGATGDAAKLTYQDVWKGGTALAHGPITYYADGKQAEFTGSELVSCTGGTKPPVERPVHDSTLADVLTIGAALDDGDSNYDLYKFQAYVTKQDTANYFLTATKAEALDQQTSDAAHGAKKYYANAFEVYGASDAVAAKLLKNAKVEITVSVKNYHGQVENDLPVAEAQVTVLEAGAPWVIPEHNATVAEGLTVVDGLEDNGTTEDLYVFTEVYVTAITGAYDSQYGNMSFKIADTADGTNTITVFRAKTDATTAAKVVVGAQVTIKGNLNKNVYNGNTTPQLKNVQSITVKESGEGGGGEQTAELYKLDGTVQATDNDAHDASNYSKSLPTTQNGVTWDVYANTTMNPWRIGGKSITNQDRKVVSKNAVSTTAVKTVKVKLGAMNIGSFNSLKMGVGTAEEGNTIDEITVTTGLEANAEITFSVPEGHSWANAYFTFTFNVTESGTSNKYVQLVSITFLSE